MEQKKTLKYQALPWMMMAGALIITLYSHSSPLYIMNTWVDVNGNLTIGKCIANGIVIYRDIFEQRGPILYFLHTIAYLISRHSFYGIWFLEMIFSCGFVYYAYKILALYGKQKNILFMPLLLLLIYSSGSFGLGGSPEEFCLPIITASIYILLRALKERRLLNFREYLEIGVLSGAVLWIKFSMLGFYIGSVIPVLFMIFRKKDLRNLVHLLTGVCAGVLIVSLPVFAYFLINHALESLFHVYFYINLNYYPFNDSFLYKMYFAVLGFFDAMKSNWKYWIVTVIGLVCLFRTEKKPIVIAELLFGAAGLSIVIYSGGQQFAYYALILSVYSIFGLLVVPEFGKKTAAAVSALSMIFFAAAAFPKITRRIHTVRDDYVQYRFAKQIEPDSTLLNYQFLDGGFFFAADLIPSEYYAWSFNVLNDEIRAEQNRYVEEGRTDYIVTTDRDVEEADTGHRYELIAEDSGYCLYRRIS